MSAASQAHAAVAIGSLLGAFVLAGCGDGVSGYVLIDASSDVAPASDTVTLTATDTSTATSTDGSLADPAPDAPLGPDLPDGGCPAHQVGVYLTPGCGAAAQRICVDQTLDACGALIHYCGCDGETTHMVPGCGGSDKPYLHQGACKVDAATDAEAPCRMELEVFTCQPGWTSMLCCPPAFDGKLASVPGCDPENLDEATRAGRCDGSELLHRVSGTGGTITCSYAASGNLVGAYVRAGSSRVIPFCMTSRTAIAGEAIPSTCDPTGLPLIRSCTIREAPDDGRRMR